MHTNGQKVYKKVLNITNQQGNANQTTVRRHLIPVGTAIIKKIKDKYWRVYEEKRTLE